MPHAASAFAVTIFASLVCAAPLALPAQAHDGATLASRRAREGDVLRIFEKTRVYIITNDDTRLADALLVGAKQKERRVFSPEEWRKLPRDVRHYVSTVFLINRERLAQGETLPDSLDADGDELVTKVTRSSREGGTFYDVTLSAPDGAWLKQAVADFRRLSEPPRTIQKRNVRSLAVISLGAGASAAASPLLVPKRFDTLAHSLSAPNWQAAQSAGNLAQSDEIFLIDRSTAQAADTASLALETHTIGKTDSVVWRESKPGGYQRIVFSAPNSELLARAVQQCSDPFGASESPTVLGTARDLRSVRRIAVAGVRSGAGGADLAQRLASRTATEIRSLDTFEVLERAGLSEILGEIALDQAGITKSKDRAKVRQMAAADALLIVEVTDASGRSDYQPSHERLTPPMGKPPRRPLEPSRLKYAISIPGKENDATVQGIADALLSRVVGRKTDREYKQDLNQYNTETLPAWQRDLDDYNERYRRRAVTWREEIAVKSTVTVSGSLRLVDLTDGLVLWEAPFTASEQGTGSWGETRTLTTRGEESRPGDTDCPAPDTTIPNALLVRTAESALENGVQALRGTALLPRSVAPTTIASVPGEDVSLPLSGRLLDVDGNALLIGLGAGDGIKLGDPFSISLPDGQIVRAMVTRVRPRTCDAAFAKETPARLQAKVTVGMTATPLASTAEAK